LQGSLKILTTYLRQIMASTLWDVFKPFLNYNSPYNNQQTPMPTAQPANKPVDNRWNPAFPSLFPLLLIPQKWKTAQTYVIIKEKHEPKPY